MDELLKKLEKENKELEDRLRLQLIRTKDLINSLKYYQKQELELTIDRITKFINNSFECLNEELKNKVN